MGSNSQPIWQKKKNFLNRTISGEKKRKKNWEGEAGNYEKGESGRKTSVSGGPCRLI